MARPLLRTLDEATFRRVDRLARIIFTVLLVIATILLVNKLVTGTDGVTSIALLLYVLVRGLWDASVRPRLDPANAGRDWSIPEDDGYRGPLPPEKQFPR